jgi:hypothetical protein
VSKLSLYRTSSMSGKQRRRVVQSVLVNPFAVPAFLSP